MAFVNGFLAVDAPHHTTFLEVAGLGSQAHGAAHVGTLVALLGAAVDVLPLGDQGHDGMRGGRVHLGGIRALEAAHVAGVLHQRHVHAQADPQEGNIVFAGVAHRGDLALHAPVAEASRHQDGVHILQQGGALALDILGIDILDLHLGEGLQASVLQGLVQRLVGIQQVDVLADHGHPDLAAGLAELALDDLFPVGQVRLFAALQAKALHHEIIEVVVAQHAGNAIDRIGVQQRDDRPLLHVGEQGYFLASALLDVHGAAAQQDIGLQANRSQFLDRVLGGLGLDLAGGSDIGHQGQVHQQGAAGAHFNLQLAGRFEEGQALDIPHGTTYFHHGDIGIAGAEYDPALDLIGDMGNDLDGATQVITATLLAQHGVVHPAGGEVVGALHGGMGEALVVAQVQVGLGTVLGDEHLAVLEGAHGARVDVDIGIELEQGNPQASRFQHGCQGRGGNTLAQRGHHTTCDEDVTRHNSLLSTL